MQANQRRVLITGATGGIGREFALQIAGSGACVMLAGRNDSRLCELIGRLPGEGHQAIQIDLSDPSERAKLLEKASDFRLNSLVNLAGSNQLSFLADTDAATLQQMIDINLTVPMLLSNALLPVLQSQEQAEIVNVGSILGSIGYAGSTIYCATKFGLRGFTEALRRELADSRIRVVYFAPRATDTEMNTTQTVEMNKSLGVAMDPPKRVAKELMELLCSAKTKNYYMGWPEKFFVRFNGLFPSVVDKALLKQLATIRHFSHHSN